MAGISSLGVTEEQSLATIQRAFEQGVNFFDSAFSYGYDGESDRLLARTLKGVREQVAIASKVGQSWNSKRERVIDGKPETLLRHAQQCLERLDTDYVDIMYLHVPDPHVPLSESASAIGEICRRGWARTGGVCNVNLEQAQEFVAHCPTGAIQIPFNMLQQESLLDLAAFAETYGIRLVCYWIYMKGILAGRMSRNHVLDSRDKRLTYPIYQGDAWERAQNLLDVLRGMAQRKRCEVNHLVIAWALKQKSMSFALVGAKNPLQISESLLGHTIELTELESLEIDRAIRENRS